MSENDAVFEGEPGLFERIRGHYAARASMRRLEKSSHPMMREFVENLAMFTQRSPLWTPNVQLTHEQQAMLELPYILLGDEETLVRENVQRKREFVWRTLHGTYGFPEVHGAPTPKIHLVWNIALQRAQRATFTQPSKEGKCADVQFYFTRDRIKDSSDILSVLSPKFFPEGSWQVHIYEEGNRVVLEDRVSNQNHRSLSLHHVGGFEMPAFGDPHIVYVANTAQEYVGNSPRISFR